MGRPVLARVLAWADDPRPRMREMGCYILGQLGSTQPTAPETGVQHEELLPTLIRVLESDPDGDVRGSAASAFGHMKSPEAIPALCRTVADPCPEARFGVACALGGYYDACWNEQSLPLKPQATAALLKLMDDPDDDVRDWATFGAYMGGHDSPEVRARLWQALDDPNPDVRGEAASGLAEFRDRSLIPRLEQLLRHDPDLSPCFFEAARILGAAELLPAVREGAVRWNEMGDGEPPHYLVKAAVEDLSEVARLEQRLDAALTGTICVHVALYDSGGLCLGFENSINGVADTPYPEGRYRLEVVRTGWQLQCGRDIVHASEDLCRETVVRPLLRNRAAGWKFLYPYPGLCVRFEDGCALHITPDPAPEDREMEAWSLAGPDGKDLAVAWDGQVRVFSRTAADGGSEDRAG